MINFELNKGRGKVEIERLLKKLAKIIFAEFKKSGVISIAYVSGAKVKKYNTTYRHKNKTTDILTFVFDPVRSPLRHRRGGSRLERLTSNGVDESEYLGEIILSPKDVARRAKLMNKTLQETVIFLIVHGILHIMGYTHKKTRDTAEMEKKEKKLLKKLWLAL